MHHVAASAGKGVYHEPQPISPRIPYERLQLQPKPPGGVFRCDRTERNGKPERFRLLWPGAGSGELCGAISGAIMVLGMLTPVDTNDPVNSKLRAVAQGREFLRRFSQRFGAVRCETLLPMELTADDRAPAAKELGITDHCSILAATAAEIVEEMLRERQA